ncbi:cysteine desulfurase family protein [Allorhodopirellula heiligendammensis]|uniref:cysteine desulfurase n=1 Tax=Allorhodopirellula heiligendammensis TaxID=2714739 RepID=A0A5C6C5E5_9BACT|nr:cysteine desulfurase family protein [Allorhodopirellula heiligendammensis]TWU19840.1 Cysteine desulfurase [Allorhodopirellula heiligendammensis]
MQPIYLDNCSTTRLDSSVLAAMLPFFTENFGNPGTPHEAVGGVVQRAIRQAREAVATLINCIPNEIVWTSGATEANNLAILGLASKQPPGKRHIITQATEHSAVLEPCRHLESEGWQVTYLNVDEFGNIDLDELRNSIRDDTALVSIMWGNNEIGTIHPVAEIASICGELGIPVHCDAAQAAGKVAIDVEAVHVSLLTLSAHKFYGPKGAGALYIRDLGKAKSIDPRLYGGGQEKGIRPGTLNVPCIVGLGEACRLASQNRRAWSEHISGLRDRFETMLLESLKGVSVNGNRESRLPHISNIAFLGADGEGLLTMLLRLPNDGEEWGRCL